MTWDPEVNCGTRMHKAHATTFWNRTVREYEVWQHANFRKPISNLVPCHYVILQNQWRNCDMCSLMQLVESNWNHQHPQIGKKISHQPWTSNFWSNRSDAICFVRTPVAFLPSLVFWFQDHIEYIINMCMYIYICLYCYTCCCFHRKDPNTKWKGNKDMNKIHRKIALTLNSKFVPSYLHNAIYCRFCSPHHFTSTPIFWFYFEIFVARPLGFSNPHDSWSPQKIKPVVHLVWVETRVLGQSGFTTCL